MEHLELGGKKYMKVSSAARETGYTSDYIGQLCRAKKIDAKLVGRTWYVAQDEITNHKRTRGRSSYEKTRKAVRAAIVEKNEETIIPVRIASTDNYRSRLTRSEVSYHADDTELIPTVSGSQRTETVHLAVKGKETDTAVSINDASPKRVAVSEHEEMVRFNKTAPKEVSWNGTIVVSALPDEQESEALAPRVSAMEKHLRVATEDERNNKPKLAISDVSHDPLVAQSRFLERMNLAHDLNKIQSVASKMKRAVDAHTGSNSLEPRMAQAVPNRTRAVLSEVRELPQKRHLSWSLLGLTLTAVSVSCVVVVASSFLAFEYQYRTAPAKAGEVVAPYTSQMRLNSMAEARKVLASTISSIRNTHILSRF